MELINREADGSDSLEVRIFVDKQGFNIQLTG